MKVLITGAGSGIGKECVKLFLNNGYECILLDKNPKVLEQKGKNVDPYICDIKNYQAVQNVINKLDNIDVLINCAAIQYVDSFTEINVLEWNEVIDTNLNGTFYVIKEVVKKMKKGVIINLSSVHGELPRLNKMSYDVTKAGINMMTKELALALAPNIRVNALAIGATMTPMNNCFIENPQTLKDAKSKVPLDIILDPKEVANVIYLMCSNQFQNMTGTILTYDGGRSLK